MLGPRGTGKTTWLKDHEFKLSINLLNSAEYLSLKAKPFLLQARTAHLVAGDWVLIDEIQKVPALLDEVHLLYEDKKLNFALSGSSARKLKRQGANLLAGRALNLSIFPLCYAEYQDSLDLEFRLKWGTLPLVVDNKEYLEETISSYVHTYLKQEIAEEGLVRKLDAFSRFLQVAALYNGKMLNYQQVADNCYLSRPVVTQYFQILFDTLLAYKLPAWKPRLKVREVNTPKFFFFDPGIAAGCLELNYEVDRSYLGYSLENLITNEIRAYISYAGKKAEIYYYSVSNSFEIDLIISFGGQGSKNNIIAIEIKLAENWDERWSSGLKQLVGNNTIAIQRKIGIYTGKQIIRFGDIDVMPVDHFLADMFSGKIF